MIRPCEPEDFPQVYRVINDAAMAYKGRIPDDRWHEPYMPESELRGQIAEGVRFSCYVEDGSIIGVMGLQDKGDVSLIRHAYVSTSRRQGGIGTALMREITRGIDAPILIGTWEDATWAVRFYEKNGFSLVPTDDKNLLLSRYWNVPARQIESSVVLADRRYFARGNGIRVVKYAGEYAQEIRELILDIQRNEFNIPITIADQPDLGEIESFYQAGNGNFWVALNAEDRVIGTIASKDIGGGLVALRKLFVRRDYRGKPYGVARYLLDAMLSWSRGHGVSGIYLGTTDRYLAAHRFYEKSGFTRIEKESLPESFPIMKVDSVFYARSLA